MRRFPEIKAGRKKLLEPGVAEASSGSFVSLKTTPACCKDPCVTRPMLGNLPLADSQGLEASTKTSSTRDPGIAGLAPERWKPREP